MKSLKRIKHENKNLTQAEKIVLTHVASGLSNLEIAKNEEISVRTVETHRAHIYRKLKIKGVAKLVHYAVMNNYIRI